MTKYTVNIKQSPDGVMTFDLTVNQDDPNDDIRPVLNTVTRLSKLLNSHFDVKHQKYMLGIKEGK